MRKNEAVARGIFCDLIFFILYSCLSCTHVAPLVSWKWETSENSANLSSLLFFNPFEFTRQTITWGIVIIPILITFLFKLFILLNSVKFTLLIIIIKKHSINLPLWCLMTSREWKIKNVHFFHPLPPHTPKKCQMVIHTFHYHRHENARDCELKSSYRDHETIVNESSSRF